MSRFRERSYPWMALWFLAAGVVVIYVFMGLDSLGAALNHLPNAKPSGVGRFLMEVGPYCLVGGAACFVRCVERRAMFFLVAHFVTFGIGLIEAPRNSLMFGAVLSGVMLVPFGPAWMVLLTDFLNPKANAERAGV